MERKTSIYDVCVRLASVLFRVDSVAVCGDRRGLTYLKRNLLMFLQL
jgi:hypothetical protein